jgi:hypothetical protein
MSIRVQGSWALGLARGFEDAGTIQYMKIFIRFVFNRKEQPESHTHACRDADE